MEHLAIDVGGRESQICLRTSEGRIVEEARWRTHDIPKLLSLRSPTRVILETCAESFWIADGAMAAGHEVVVVPSMLVRGLGVGSRRTKTDRRDCQLLSEASCRMPLPSVHIPSSAARQRKTMLSLHEGLIASRTMLINATRGWMRGQALRCRSGAAKSFPERVRQALEQHQHAGRPYVERTLTTIAMLSEQIQDSERELGREAKSDPVCQRLMSVPGVGPMTAVSFAAALDVCQRFENAHKVQAYLGLTPGEHSSSDRVQRTSITKAGCTRTRWLLIQAAWVARRRAPNDPMVRWSLEVEKRRGKRIAVTALARKLAGILFAVWRDGSLYNPTEGTNVE